MEKPRLAPKQEQWRSEVREHLQTLQHVIGKLHAEEEDHAALRNMLRQLDELFLLVVAGEFNSGKSAFINALVGRPALEEGVIPTTSRIQILAHGEPGERPAADESAVTITIPTPLLEDMRIVDTPGTNAIERRHEAITEHFIPRADLILFVTSADRPFTESERAFLSRIRAWGKKIIFIVNKIDLFETAADLARVEAYVRDNARQLLGIDPEIFPISARLAFRAKTGEGRGLAESRFDALEQYLTRKLDEQERVRLKLLSPLGVARHIGDKHLAIVEERAQVLRQDVQMIEEIERQLAQYEQDMNRDFRLRLTDVDNVLHQMEARGHEFIEDVVRLPRIFDLANKEKVRGEFERKVVANAPAEIEKRIEEIIDWLVSSDLQQWQFVKDHITRHRSEQSKKALGDVGSGFDYDRRRLADSVGRAAQRTLENYDRHAEASRMAESVQGAVANTALLEVGAVGVGTAVALVASSTAADVTGLLAAGVLATLGFLVIPQKRRTAKKELREKISALREQLMTALTRQFADELQRSVRRLQEGIGPYTRWVRAEERNLAERREELRRERDAMARLASEIERP